MWVARDEDGGLYLFTRKPYKSDVVGAWVAKSFDHKKVCQKIDNKLLPEVRWEDEDPTEVKIVKK